MPYVKVRTGASLYYERVGKGPPLLLIMGTGLDHTCWQHQLPAYSREYECICFDNRGTGKSSATSDMLTTRLLAEDAAGLLDALDIERAHVSGLSLGSCVAQELCLGWPRRVQTLQLHGTWGRAHGYAARKFRSQLRLLDVLSVPDFYEINVLWFITPQYFSSFPERVSAQIKAIVDAAPPQQLLRAQYTADLEHDALNRLSGIAVPTLVTVGSFDVALPPMYSKEVAEAIPNSKLVVFEGGGHLHNVENPEEFNRVTLDFLQSKL